MTPDTSHLLDLAAGQMGVTKSELLNREPRFDVDIPDWVRGYVEDEQRPNQQQ
jgi:hypothetical protein